MPNRIQEVTFYFHGLIKRVFLLFKLHPITFFSILLLSPLEEDVAIHLNIIEPPLPKDTRYEVWLKLAMWFWRRFSNVFNIYISICCYHPPLEKGVGPLFKRNITQGCSVPSLFEIFPVVLGKG